MRAATIDPPHIINGAVITNWYAQLESCDKDNILYFYDNTTYKFDEGALKCDASDQQNISGNWVLLSSNQLLRIVYQQDTAIYDVQNLEANELKLSYQLRDTANVLHTITATYRNN